MFNSNPWLKTFAWACVSARAVSQGSHHQRTRGYKTIWSHLKHWLLLSLKFSKTINFKTNFFFWSDNCDKLCNLVLFSWKLFWNHCYTCMSQAHCTFPSRNAVQISLGPNAQWNGSRFARGLTRFHCPFSFLHVFIVLRIILQFYKLNTYFITTSPKGDFQR